MIYKKYKKPSNNQNLDLWVRLWEEIENSKTIAEEIENKLALPVEIHIDISTFEKYKSYKLLQNSLSYLQSFGFQVKAKPNSFVASCAADILIR